MPVGRNDPCICGSGIKYKKCCIRIAEERQNPSEGRVGAYITAADLWPGKRVSWDETMQDIAEYPKRWFCELMCRIGITLHEEYVSKSHKHDLNLCKAIFDPQDVRKILLWFRSGKRQKALARQNILAALLCRLSMPEAPEASNHLATRGVGPLLLRLNTLLDREVSADSEQAGGGSRTRQERSFGSSFRDIRLSTEANFNSAIPRYWALYTEGFAAVNQRYPGEAFDFSKALQLATGCTPVQLLAFGFSMWTFYKKDFDELFSKPENFRFGRDHFRLTSPAARRHVDVALAFLSDSVEAHAAAASSSWAKCEYYDIRQFYNRPLLGMADDAFSLIDIPLLQQRITDGLFLGSV